MSRFDPLMAERAVETFGGHGLGPTPGHGFGHGHGLGVSLRHDTGHYGLDADGGLGPWRYCGLCWGARACLEAGRGPQRYYRPRWGARGRSLPSSLSLVHSFLGKSRRFLLLLL